MAGLLNTVGVLICGVIAVADLISYSFIFMLINIHTYSY